MSYPDPWRAVTVDELRPGDMFYMGQAGVGDRFDLLVWCLDCTVHQRDDSGEFMSMFGRELGFVHDRRLRTLKMPLGDGALLLDWCTPAAACGTLGP